MTRKTLPTSRRAAVWRAHECRCVYCAELIRFADLDLDHIVPYRLIDRPDELVKLLDEYGLSKDFDLNSRLNLLPAHRRCNLQKRGLVLSKSRALYFLAIAEDRYDKACRIELELKDQALKDRFSVMVQVALEEGRISIEDLDSLLNRYAEGSSFEVLTALPFMDSELRGFIFSTDIDSLYDRSILPRRNGLNELVMVRATSHGEEIRKVLSCREWTEAVREGYCARTTYDIKEETLFKRVYALVVALAQAAAPKHKFISDSKASIANFDLLPVTLLPALSSDSFEELQRFKTEGVTVLDLIVLGRVKIVSSSPLSLTLHYDYMGLYLNEILRADFNGDGVEDLLVGVYQKALGGTYGAGGAIALTRLGVDQPFTVVDDIEFDIKWP